MTMTIDPNQQRFSPFDQMSYSAQPQFSNPWASSTTSTQVGHQGMYVTSHDHAMSGGLPSLGLGGGLPKHTQPSPVSRTSAGPSTSLASYGSMPATAASAGSPLMADTFYGTQDSLSLPQDHLMSLNRLPHQTSAAGYDTTYATASPVHPTYPQTTAPSYDLGYAPAPSRSTFALAPAAEADSRRYSQANLRSGDDRRAFADAIEASQGMLSMSQETPRNIYEANGRPRGSADSYGFPSTHSTHSSISSGGFGSYYAGSVDSSVSDYSTAGSDIESVTSRTLPRPQELMVSQAPPAPQSMMSQFSSKVTSSTQKKHKCKVCDKRFTRPSSLQTHMYSHTGEKPFCCEVDGCGRHFSVVSNLRRHRKVHKGGNDAQSEAGSEGHSEYSDDK